MSPINNPTSASEKLIREKLILHSYHAFPPFLTGTKTGLTYDLADYLNHQQSDYIFEVKLMPRKRLDSMLDRESIIIPWVTAAWFGPDAAMKYQWSPPVMKDGNLYIWKTGSDTSFRRPLDLVGYKLGGIRGTNTSAWIRWCKPARSNVLTSQQNYNCFRCSCSIV